MREGLTLPSKWNMSSYVLVRMSGAAQDALADLRFETAASHVRRLHDMRAWLDAQREHVCDQVMFQLIGFASGAQKSHLVGIRRKLYNGKLPKIQDMSVVTDHVDRGARRYILRYYLRLRRYQLLTTGEPARRAHLAFTQELERKRDVLVNHLAAPQFLKALQVASPSLAASVAKLVARPTAVWAKKERQVEVRAVRYLTRMLIKTSPFGRFGPVALATYDESCMEVASFDTASSTTETVSSLNLSFVDRLIAALALHPELSLELPVKVNSSYFLDGQDICFYSPAERNHLPKYTTLRRGRFLRQIQVVVEFLEITREDLTALQLAESLFSHKSAEFWETREKALRFVESLVSSGLLVRELAVPTNTMDRLDGLTQLLSSKKLILPPLWAVGLQELRELGRDFAGMGLKDRDRAIRRADQILGQLLENIDDPSERMARDRRLFVEDTYVRGGTFRLGRPFWQHVGADLTAFVELLCRRDRGGLGYQMMKDIFIQHYGDGGVCDDAGRFGNELGKTAFRAMSMDSADFKHSARVNENSWRYFRWLQSSVDAAGDADDIDLGREHIDALAQELSGWELPRASIALHLQFVADSTEALEAGDFQVVLNYTLPGHGRFFTRYCAYYDKLSASPELSDQLAAQTHRVGESVGGIEAVEMVSIVNHNAQIHRPLTGRVIVAPGEHVHMPSENVIGMRQLQLRHDSKSGEMRVFASGTEILPLYMGFFHSMALPFSHRVLVDASPHAFHAERFKLLEFSENTGTGAGRRGESFPAIRHYPRLRCGRLIIQRQAWVVDFAELAAHFVGPSDDFDLFIKSNLWRLCHGLPSTCFVRIRAKRENPAEIASSVKPNEHKPMYLDFENFFTVRSFAAACASQAVDTVHFEEALPKQGDTPLLSSGAPVTLEMQIEINRQTEAAHES